MLPRYFIGRAEAFGADLHQRANFCLCATRYRSPRRYQSRRHAFGILGRRAKAKLDALNKTEGASWAAMKSALSETRAPWTRPIERFGTHWRTYVNLRAVNWSETYCQRRGVNTDRRTIVVHFEQDQGPVCGSLREDTSRLAAAGYGRKEGRKRPCRNITSISTW